MPSRMVGVRLSKEDSEALEELKRIYRLRGLHINGDADALRTLLREEMRPVRPSEMPVFAGLLQAKPRNGKRKRRAFDIDEVVYGKKSKHAKHLRRRRPR